MTIINRTQTRELVVGQRGEVLLDPLSHGGEEFLIKAGYEVLSAADALVEATDAELELKVASVRYTSWTEIDEDDQPLREHPDLVGTVEVWLYYDDQWHMTAWPHGVEFVEWDELHELNNQMQMGQ